MKLKLPGLPCVISDNVPPECIKTDRVFHYSLEKPLDFWANKIIEAAKIEKNDTYDEIVASGFVLKIMQINCKTFTLRFVMENENGNFNCIYTII